ncbi:MAG: hypothetical protein AVDCRST_MAG77-2318 [uncultured Chloroflexi bacterium]|uniref:DUF983 domain-containing protein n=1 Tax=uncultured Chloroflexota bacterium TaxID=166587 RepID=A0A6J4IKW9_9CHLR|nr:MAG: hypothetical protein AVDCRST_MAG77-2318 [uncultured Chloroflexota bacterium]
MTALGTAGALVAGFLLRCPVCRRGGIFPSLLSYRMRERCPACGVELMPDRGEVTGGMAITMVLTSILGVVGVIYLAVFTTISPAWAVAWLIAAPTLFAVWFYRHAHGLWVAVLFLTRNMNEAHPLASMRRTDVDAERAGTVTRPLSSPDAHGTPLK